MFISTAPLRINLNHDLSFAEFVKQISSNTMSLLRHQRYPYQAILEDLRKKILIFLIYIMLFYLIK